MCTVSMIGDYYRDKWNPPPPGTFPHGPMAPPGYMIPVSKEEFDALKKEVMEMKELLKRAIDYDIKNNQPHCEIEEKMEFLREVAKLVGVDLDDVIGKSKKK